MSGLVRERTIREKLTSDSGGADVDGRVHGRVQENSDVTWTKKMLCKIRRKFYEEQCHLGFFAERFVSGLVREKNDPRETYQ